MHVRFSRVNEDDNTFDFLGYVYDVTPDAFERIRELESGDGEPQEVVADLMPDNYNLIDVVILPRQRHATAASLLKMRSCKEPRP